MKLPEAIGLCRELADTEGASHYGDALRTLLSAVEHAGDARTDMSRKGTPEYRAWKAMKARCYAPNNASYASHGGRGISVCQAWRDSFEAFLQDVGYRPSPFHSLDRRDNDTGYEPRNVRWATKQEQSQNRSVSHELEHEGQKLCIAEWARRTKIAAPTIESRIRMGWSVADTLTVPVGTKR